MLSKPFECSPYCFDWGSRPGKCFKSSVLSLSRRAAAARGRGWLLSRVGFAVLDEPVPLAPALQLHAIRARADERQIIERRALRVPAARPRFQMRRYFVYEPADAGVRPDRSFVELPAF